MASLKKVFCANLGIETVSLAEFQVLPRERLLALQAWYQEALRAHAPAQAVTASVTSSTSPFIPSPCSWETQVGTALHKLRTTAQIEEGEKLCVALPSLRIFTRFVQLPPISTQNLPSFLRSEAQKHIPFPMEEVTWATHLLRPSPAGAWEAAFIATKTLPLSILNRAIGAAGFSLHITDVAPWALYNAFRWNYPEVEECSLLLNITSRTTHLLFVQREKIFMRNIASSSIPLGNRGLSGDILRSLAFYQNIWKGPPPLRVFLCGEATREASLQTLCQETLQMPVEIFHPLRNVIVPSEKEIPAPPQPLPLLGELVGLATRAWKNPPAAIQLCAPEVVHEQTLVRRKLFLLGAGVCLALVLAGWALFYQRAAMEKAQTLLSLESTLQSQKTLHHQMAALYKELHQLDASLHPFFAAVAERERWHHWIDTLAACLPPEFLWITHLEPTLQNKPSSSLHSAFALKGKRIDPRHITHLAITGLYLENPKQAALIDAFVAQLAHSPLFAIEDPAQVIKVRDTPDGKHWAYRYMLLLPLRHPLTKL